MLRRYKSLLTPISFLRLRGPDLPAYQWWIPAILTILFLIVFYILPVSPPLLTEKGLVITVNSLLSTLIGFYIAALAAVATFPSSSLDAEMRGRTPTIVIYRQGQYLEQKLTRRRFLVILFGYCAFLSMMVFVLGVGSLIIAPSIGKVGWVAAVKFVWLAAYFWMAASMFVATLLGLHYLIDRMHRE